ncbi:MAG: epoxide hydrolase 1 [Propionibacteriaceae bacterium]|nr:epoxide hydrolase 1 [Propionibacteriaceae bacterium]
MISIEPYTFSFDPSVVQDVLRRLANANFPISQDERSWEYGTSVAYMREFRDYWLNHYDWQKNADHINQYPQHIARIDDDFLHYVKVEGKGKNPRPLLMLHGYPWSFLTFYRIIPYLTDPGAHGGDPDQSFTVIVPSLRGFALSAPGREGFGLVDHATLYRRLMREALGYDTFCLQGGDWGSHIAWYYARAFPEDLWGLHLSFMGTRGQDGRSEAEKTIPYLRGYGARTAPILPATAEDQDYWNAVMDHFINRAAYAHINTTAPQSLSFAMCDSPLGMAAWLVEKYRQWTDYEETFEEHFSKDHLITTTMLYYLDQAFSSAIKIYRDTSRESVKYTAADRVTVKTALAAMPKDVYPAPEHVARRYFNLVSYRSFEHGGHFNVHECAEPLSEHIREFFFGQCDMS